MVMASLVWLTLFKTALCLAPGLMHSLQQRKAGQARAYLQLLTCSEVEVWQIILQLCLLRYYTAKDLHLYDIYRHTYLPRKGLQSLFQVNAHVHVPSHLNKYLPQGHEGRAELC